MAQKIHTMKFMVTWQMHPGNLVPPLAYSSLGENPGELTFPKSMLDEFGGSHETVSTEEQFRNA